MYVGSPVFQGLAFPRLTRVTRYHTITALSYTMWTCISQPTHATQQKEYVPAETVGDSGMWADCQVRVYSGRGSSQVRTKTDEGRGQRAGQEISPAGVGDRLDSMTKDNER